MKTSATATMVLWILGASAQVVEVIDSTGDGGGNELEGPRAVVIDSVGNLYIAGSESNNVFRLDADTDCLTSNVPCQWVEIMDATGAGTPGQELLNPRAMAVDSQDRLYVLGRFSDNLWRINNPQKCSTSGTLCEVHEVINAQGDGTHDFDGPFDVVIDHLDNLYVTGTSSNNIFRITASSTCNTQSNPCTITEVVDASGNGSNSLFQPSKLAVDGFGNLFSANFGDNVLMIHTPGDCSTTAGNCLVTTVLDDEDFDILELGRGLGVDGENNVFVTSYHQATGAIVYRINAPATCGSAGQPCQTAEIFNDTASQQADELVFDEAGNLFIAGGNADSVIRIKQPQSCTLSAMDCEITTVIDATGDGDVALESVLTLAVSDRDIWVPGFSSDNAFWVMGVAELSDLIFEDGFD